MSKPSATIMGPVTNSAGGNAMFNKDDLLFFNRYVSANFTDTPEEKATAFKDYMEKENQKKKQQAQLDVVKQSQLPVTVTMQAASRSDKFKGDPASTISGNAVNKLLEGTVAGPAAEVSPAQKVTKQRVRKCYIDSGDRDQVAFPNISDYEIFLGHAFENVIRIKLIDMQFPNVVSSIGSRNNMIYWRNLEDQKLSGSNTFFTYPAQIKTGTYTIISLSNQLASALNSVNIKRLAGSGSAHYFIIDLNRDTDLVSFTSIIATAADSNPVYTTNGSGYIRIKQTNHGYVNLPNQKTIIHVIGIRGNVGGIPASELNGAFSITVIDNNFFSYEIATLATSTVSGAGGSFVKTGKEAPFQFLFGEYPNPIADALGFPVENSSVIIDVENPLTSIIRPLTSPDSTNLNAAVEIGSVTKIWCADHGLFPGDRVYLYNFHVSPSIYEDDKHKGIFEIHQVLSDDCFTIDWYTTGVSDVSTAYIGTQVLHMYYPNHGFNEIADISEVPPGSGVIQVTTKWPHTYKTNDGVLLTGTNTVPLIDGFHDTITVTGDDTFTFTWYENPAAPLSSPLLHLTSSGNRGILTSDHTFYLYNVAPFGGYLSSDLNNSLFTIRKILDSDSFIFTSSHGFSSLAETGGGKAIRINSKIHGWRGTQDNTIGGLVYKPINLAGPNYCYLCTPNLKNDAVFTTGSVKNILAKLYLPVPPTFVVFNEFDATPLEFETPIPRLDTIRFAATSPTGDLLDFAGLNYSFSLEITELVQTDSNNNMSSTHVVADGQK